jgi:ADP-heptose:LPS heptosyltransferase
MARFSGARRIHCLGDAEITPRLLSHRVVPVIRDEHAVERYLRLVADLGVPIERPLAFPLPAGKQPALVELPERFLLVHPFSRGEGKSIAGADLKRLCEILAPIPIVLVGRASATFQPLPNCTGLLNKTCLSELIWLIRRAHFTLSVDSGPMHIAAAITGRLLGIHTWTNPRIVGPYNPEAWVWKCGAICQVKTLAENGPNSEADVTGGDIPAVAAILKIDQAFARSI